MAALPAQVAHAQRARAGRSRRLAESHRAAVDIRAALARLPVMRKHDCRAPAGRAGADAFGGFSAIGWGAATRRSARRACSSRPARSTSPRARGPTTGGWARAVRRRLSRRRPGAQLLQLPLHAGRRDDGERRPAIGCTVFPAGIGQTEQQIQAIAELQPDAYVGTPSFLQHPREGRRDRRRAAVAEEGARSAARRSRRRCATGSRRAASAHTRATAPPTSASSPTRPRRAKAWCSTKT